MSFAKDVAANDQPSGLRAIWIDMEVNEATKEIAYEVGSDGLFLV